MVETEERANTTVDSHQPELRHRRLGMAVLAWVGMVVLAIANATVRELLVTDRVGEYAAHVASTASLLVLLAGYVTVYFRRTPGHTNRELGLIGVIWAGLTVAFEFGFGHYVAGESWAALLALYDVTRGNVWIVVPLFLLVAPTAIGRVFHESRDA